MIINYLIGDATNPIGDEKNIKCIVHCVNNCPVWGAGFVLALSKKWEQPERAYYWWAKNNKSENLSFLQKITGPFELGQIQFVHVEGKIYVINLVGQHRVGIRKIAGVKIPPVDYRSIREGFARIKDSYLLTGFSLHMPRLGCGLAGGEWSEIEKILNEVFSDTEIEIFVYDLNESVGSS